MADDEQPAAPTATLPVGRKRGGGAFAVATGIFLSRIAGLVRESTIAHFLGLSAAAAAFRAALRIPNLLQNLFGEGVLSASFIPVYARLRAEGKHEEAARVARVIGTLLALVAATLAAAGVLAAEPLVDSLAPGFDESTRELTIALVRIIFPGTALLVMSAWCLGVLNSHDKFFLSYVSPVLWNAAIIGAAIVAGRRFAGHADDSVAKWLAWGTVIGAAAQFFVQLPTVIRLLRGIRPSLATGHPGVRSTLSSFVPIVVGRGSIQITAYIDQILSSYLGEAIVAAMFNASTLFLLPISLFGMSIAASELPAMSGVAGDDQARAHHVRDRLKDAQRRVVFFIVPSSVAFGVIGGSIISLLFQTGRFGARDTVIVWFVLAGAAIGLVPNTLGRLYNSALYALGLPRLPLFAALVRLGIAALTGYLVALPLRHTFGYSAAWGAFGLTATASIAAWAEFSVLFTMLRKRIGTVGLPLNLAAGALLASALAGGAGYATQHFAHELGMKRALAALAAIGVFGGVYLAVMAIAKVPELGGITRRLARRRR
jgi:putative peptidoglycan lipid II flippase